MLNLCILVLSTTKNQTLSWLSWPQVSSYHLILLDWMQPNIYFRFRCWKVGGRIYIIMRVHPSTKGLKISSVHCQHVSNCGMWLNFWNSQSIYFVWYELPIFRKLKGNTAVFGKVYRTISQSKKRRLVFKTGVIMYIQNERIIRFFFEIYVYVQCTYLHTFMFVIKLKHRIIFLCEFYRYVNRLMRPLLRQFSDR